MTYEEYVTWVEYRKKNGPLNPMLRNDRGFALVACAMTGEKDPKKFMPWPITATTAEEIETQDEASLEDVNLLFGGRVETAKFKRYDPDAPSAPPSL